MKQWLLRTTRLVRRRMGQYGLLMTMLLMKLEQWRRQQPSWIAGRWIGDGGCRWPF